MVRLYLIIFLLIAPLISKAQEDIPDDEKVINNLGQASHMQTRGQLRPRIYTILSAGISGNISQFDIVQSDVVRKGQTLVKIDCRIDEANREIARARMASAKAQVQVNEKLQQLDNISSLELQLSKSELDIAEVEVKRIEVVLDECVVAAPFSGTVITKHAQAYQYVNKGDPLLEIVDPDSLEVEMVVPSTWLKSTLIDTEFQMQLDETNQKISAKVDRFVGTVDPVSQTIRVVGTILNDVDKLMPGMSGEVIFLNRK